MANAELEAIRTMLAATARSDMSTQELRAMYGGMGNMFPPPAGVTLTPADAGGVPAEWSAMPGSADNQVLFYLHGGGYVIGSIASHRHLVVALGAAAGVSTLAIDYRLAPEHPFPAAVDDALAAYRWLLGQGFAAANIAVAGDSAGGGLTIALLVAIRDAGLPQPAAAVAISPWVDLEGLGDSMTGKAAVDPMVQKAGLAGMAGAYLSGADPRTPLAAPLHADLAGIAPLLIQVGSHETLLDDATRLAAKAGAADVPVRLDIVPEMIHVWHFFHTQLADGRMAIADAGEFIRRAMAAKVATAKAA